MKNGWSEVYWVRHNSNLVLPNGLSLFIIISSHGFGYWKFGNSLLNWLTISDFQLNFLFCKFRGMDVVCNVVFLIQFSFQNIHISLLNCNLIWIYLRLTLKTFIITIHFVLWFNQLTIYFCFRIFERI